MGDEYRKDVDGWGGEYGETAGDEDPQDMALDGGGWDAADQIDTVIGDAPVDRVTTYTGTTDDIDAVNSACPYI